SVNAQPRRLRNNVSLLATFRRKIGSLQASGHGLACQAHSGDGKSTPGTGPGGERGAQERVGARADIRHLAEGESTPAPTEDSIAVACELHHARCGETYGSLKQCEHCEGTAFAGAAP